MTESTAHLDDEQISSLLDGKADPSAVVHASSCAECAARVDSWRLVVSRLASHPVLVPGTDARRSAVAAALEHAHDVDRTVTRIEEARRSRRVQVMARASGLAAAALVIAGIAFGLTQLGHSHPAAKSTAARSNTSAPAAAASGALGAGSGTNGSAVPALQFLGNFSSPAALVPALRRVAHSAAISGAPTAASPSTTSELCTARTATAAGVSPIIQPAVRAAIGYQGRPSLVWVYPASNGYRAAVITRNTCQVVVTFGFS